MTGLSSISATGQTEGGPVVALCGGVGGVKLALGLYKILPPHRLTVIVNTGDDFEHLGLHISPDLDTVLYTLAGLSDTTRGWGRADETWHFMEALRALGGDAWFQLGDRDLAMHVERTQWLRRGETLGAFAAHAAKRLGIAAQIVPMSNDAVRTIVDTDDGVMPFQRYFVESRCEPKVTGVRFDGAQRAQPAPDFMKALAQPDLAAVFICPSNPYLSIDPLFAVPGIRATLAHVHAPVIAVSPIIAGQAVKGPTAKIMAELGVPATSQAIAAHYEGLLDGLIIDTSDASDAPQLDVRTLMSATLMRNDDDRRRLAGEALAFAAGIAAERRTHADGKNAARGVSR